MAIIFLLAFFIYLPLFPGAFLMDDLRLVQTDNPLTTGQLTPASIWFQTDFPIANLVFHWEWLAWGSHPGMYHAVSVALHALSAVLLWRVLARLKIPGAWMAAVLFVVHPVCVNSVARIAELKNTLSLPFFLAGVLCYLRYETSALHSPTPPAAATRRAGTLFYTTSLIAFILALLTKTSTVMLPVFLLACAWWRRGKISRSDLVHTSPHFVLALSFGLMSVWFQKYQALAGQSIPASSALERFLGAPRVFCFYLSKALFPLNLNLVYPRWNTDPHSVAGFLPLIAIVALALLCWRYRRAGGRHVLFALGSFAILLFPALGFFDAQYLTRWQVSDHLQYLPLIAPISLVAAAIAWVRKPVFYQIGAIVFLLSFSGLASQRAHVFRSQETLMRDTIAKNPQASDAHNDLGVELAKKGALADAQDKFSDAVQSDSQNTTALSNLGQMMAAEGNAAAAKARFLAALKQKPFDPDTRARIAAVCRSQGELHAACTHLHIALLFKPSAETRVQLADTLYQLRDFQNSARQYRQAIHDDANLPGASNNLAWLLATCSDPAARDGQEAVHCAERACELSQYQQSAFVSTLAAAYAEAGRFADAVVTAEKALRMQAAAGDDQSALLNRQLLILYHAGKPFHEEPPAQDIVSRL